MYRIGIVCCVVLFAWACTERNTAAESSTKPQVKEYKRMVGDILFDPTLDASPTGFIPCSENYSNQYYNFESNGLKYKGEKPQLEKEIMTAYVPPAYPLESGYIMVRFVINCKGESGYFRMQEMDENYQPKAFNEALSGQILKIVANLRGWELKKYDGTAMDFHQYLTFRIVDNQIVSIVP